MFQRDTEEAHCGAQSEVVGEYETCRYASYPPDTRLPGSCQKAHARRLLHWKGSRQRSLKRSIYANDFKVSEFGREIAVSKFREKMATGETLQSTLWKLSGARLICHCSAKQAYHADVIIEAYHRRFPNSFDRKTDNGETLTSSVLNYLALLRQEPESESGSSTDEGWMGRKWRSDDGGLRSYEPSCM